MTHRAIFSRPAAFGPYIYMEDDLKTISVVFFHLIMVLCDGLSANHAKFASYIASLKFRYLESNLMT